MNGMDRMGIHPIGGDGVTGIYRTDGVDMAGICPMDGIDVPGIRRTDGVDMIGNHRMDCPDIPGIRRKLNIGERVVVESRAPEDTYAIGSSLGETSAPGAVFALVGDLGVGKTVFTQGFAKGLGVTGPVNSPTFTILQIYEEGRVPFYHFDVYRITDLEEMDEIGYEDYFYGEGVCLVEWADLVKEILPQGCVRVAIEKDLEKGFDYRRITLERAV